MCVDESADVCVFLGILHLNFNPLDAFIVVAKISLSTKNVFIKENYSLCQCIKLSVNALVRVLRLYSNVCTLLTAYASIL